MSSPTVLVTDNLGGNLHAAAAAINNLGLAEFVLIIDFSGSSTVVVYRMTAAQRDDFKARGILR